jgi:hypothetical protein
MVLYLFASPSCPWVESLDLEKVAKIFPALIRGKRKLQDHIIASLTHITASFRLEPRWEAGYPMVFCPSLIRRGYEPIWDSGEDMRRKNRR